jgi:hypothetical protein
MTMVLTAPVKPQGIRFSFRKPCGGGSGGKRFVEQKEHIEVNIEKFFGKKQGKNKKIPTKVSPENLNEADVCVAVIDPLLKIGERAGDDSLFSIFPLCLKNAHWYPLTRRQSICSTACLRRK